MSGNFGLLLDTPFFSLSLSFSFFCLCAFVVNHYALNISHFENRSLASLSHHICFSFLSFFFIPFLI